MRGAWFRRACAILAGSRTLAVAWGSALVLLAAAPSGAAPPPAGSTIENTAQATWFDTDRGYYSTMRSNTVAVIVQPQEALTLASDQTLLRAAGGAVTLAHKLTNTGNVESSYLLAVANRSDNDHDLIGLQLYWDRNGNGRADTGEPLLDGTTPLGPLAPGAAVDLVVVGIVPTSLPSGRSARVDLTVRSVLQGVRAGNRDTVTVADGALLQVGLGASNLTPTGGDLVTLALEASNVGNRPALGVPAVVDGNVLSLVLLRSTIPPNMQFVSFGAAGSAVLLYHLAGMPEHHYTRTAPPDRSAVDAVAFGFAAGVPVGQSVQRSFDVRLHANAAGSIDHAAQLWLLDGLQPQPQAVLSNLVRLVTPERAPTLNLYADSSYSRQAHAIAAGSPLFVRLDAARCNLDLRVLDSQGITVSSTLGGDLEAYGATETGANTGVFTIEPRVPTVDARTAAATRGDGVLAVLPNDTLTVSMSGCGATLLQASVLVDPYGVVFDSRSDRPVAGARVTLIDITGAGNGGRAGFEARVFDLDGVTPAPASVVTGADGHYRFPLVAPSTYRLMVLAPAGYSFPSSLAFALLPPARIVNARSSYGGEFVVREDSAPVRIDVPLDADATAGLFIEKAASRRTVELGEFVDYQVKLKNTSGQLLGRVQVTDRLPAGFAYLRGSARLIGVDARLNGSVLPEPDGGVGPVLVFHVGSIPDGGTLQFGYRVRVGPGALQGDGINRAQAITAGPLPKISNPASAQVQVLPGVFDQRGYIVGRVYADCNRNATQDPDEPGVPGVRLLLEDGSHVFTDGQGRYSMYGVRARTHVLKLDATTLPAGAKLLLTSMRQAGSAGSRFVDLSRHELHRADFALDGCDDATRREIDERAKAFAPMADTLIGPHFATLGAEPVSADLRSLPAAGVVSRAAVVPGAVALATPAVKSVPADTRLATTAPTPPEAYAELDPSLAIVVPADGQILTAAQTPVVVKGSLGSRFELTVNGRPIDARRVGRRAEMAANQAQVWEYVGIDLVAGHNVIEVRELDADGRVRAQATTRVRAPGTVASIGLAPAVGGGKLVADGRSRIELLLTLEDAQGVAVGARTAATLLASAAAWETEDLNRDEPGTQIFVEGGRAQVVLRAPAESGRVQIEAHAGDQRVRLELNFLPELRPLVAAGVVEGVIDLRRLKAGALLPATAADGFEEELRHFASVGNDGRAGARAAMFLKGKVRGDMLLTLAYDSGKDRREKLFRDISPDEYYPVYGDESVRGYDAQSTSRLYVRIDRGASYLLYGDFATVAPTLSQLAPRLSQVQRSLTGFKAHHDDGRLRVDAYASRTASRQAIDELPARGVSGPYLLTQIPYVANSERVEIVTRDRDLDSRVLRTVLLARFADYEIDSLTGRLVLRAPLPTFDSDLNPNFLRVTYEVDQGAERFWVAGASAQARIGDQAEAGAAVMQDHNPHAGLRLAGAHARVQLAPQTELLVEAARSSGLGALAPAGAAAAAQPQGAAWRAELRHESPGWQVQASVVQADPGFRNPSAALTPGRTEAQARAAVRLDQANTLRAELLHAQDENGATRQGAALALDHALTSHLRAEVGVRVSQADSIAAAAAAGNGLVTPVDSFTSLRLKVAGQWPGREALGLYGEYEQDTRDAQRRVAALGADYRLAAGGRLYARHEFISSLGNHYSLNPAQRRNVSLVGIDASVLGSAHLFSEYRLRDALGAREAEAAVGLRNTWTLTDGVTVQGGFERIDALSGSAGQDSVAVNGGVEYTADPRWKGSARIDLRAATGTHSALVSAGVAVKLDDEWTVLARQALQISRARDNAGRQSFQRMQLGVAYREAATDAGPARWNALARIEHRSERARDPAGDASTERDAVTAALHAHYRYSPVLNLSGYGAGKWTRDASSQVAGSIASRYDVYLVGGRASYEFAPDWEAGAKLYSQFSGGHRSRQDGIGLELSHAVARNLWLTLGVNRFAARDEELFESFYTQKGLFLRLRFKFDEESF